MVTDQVFFPTGGNNHQSQRWLTDRPAPPSTRPCLTTWRMDNHQRYPVPIRTASLKSWQNPWMNHQNQYKSGPYWTHKVTKTRPPPPCSTWPGSLVIVLSHAALQLSKWRCWMGQMLQVVFTSWFPGARLLDLLEGCCMMSYFCWRYAVENRGYPRSCAWRNPPGCPASSMAMIPRHGFSPRAQSVARCVASNSCRIERSKMLGKRVAIGSAACYRTASFKLDSCK